MADLKEAEWLVDRDRATSVGRRFPVFLWILLIIPLIAGFAAGRGLISNESLSASTDGSLDESYPAPDLNLSGYENDLSVAAEGKTAEVRRLLDSWTAMGWKIENARSGRTLANAYFVNGKAVALRYARYGSTGRRWCQYVINDEPIDFLRRHQGYLVAIVSRAEHFFVIPVGRVDEIVRPARTEGRGGYIIYFAPTAARTWDMRTNAGHVDITEFYQTDRPLEK